jgi:Family of unknown function (DUF5990)/Domain of unknown function (DUF5655)
VGGDADALRRLRLVSQNVTLSVAQLAVAREYGFPSWSRLKDEAGRRRAANDDDGKHAPEPALAEPTAAGAAAAGPNAAEPTVATPTSAPTGDEPSRAEPKPVEPGRAGAKPAEPGRAGAKPAEPGRAGAKPAEPGRAGAKPAEARRAGAKPAEPGGAVELKSWQQMREWAAGLLESRTGADVGAWNDRIAAAGLDDERTLREWLAGRGVTGYAQALLVWERFGYPDFLTADAEQLIDGQYADRPQLRPVLDAVLAVLPTLGPVTVQARKSLVSLVSPRRTFAVVQPTTKSRVDLGLRLDGAEPGGRLQAAGNVASGAATVRVALTGADDVDDEVRGLMRRAYEETTAPPAPRRPARRVGPGAGTLTVVIEGRDLPGRTCQPEATGPRHRNVHVALSGRSEERPALTVPGKPGLAIEPTPGDAPSARWEMPVTVRHDDGGFDFGGPFVRGDRTDRHLGLVWGDVPGDGTLRLFRGAKLRLVDVKPGLIEEAMRPGRRLVARVRLTDRSGNPICARIRPPDVAWSAEPADGDA